MPKSYEPAPPHVKARAEKLIEQHHHDLWKVEARIDYIFATNDTGDAVSHRGYPALAVVRILNLKDRTKGMGDAEIMIDAAAYGRMTPEQQDALLDHELHHLIVLRDDDGLAKTDDQGRPRFKMRKHDVDFGFFVEIAARHGINSVEVTQCRLMYDNYNQSLFPFLADKVVEVSATVVDDGSPKRGKDETTMTISSGDKSVTLTSEQLKRAARTVAKKLKK